MMTGNEKSPVVFVGAGNVGLPAVLTFALVNRHNPSRRHAFIVDFDRVEQKDVLKGYHEGLVGRFKCEGAVEMVRMLYGDETALEFTPVIAAAQSVPGLLHSAEAVFNGVDSARDGAFVSEEARNSFEIRMSTGVLEEAVHTLEVMPEGFTLGEVSYDLAAWADASRQECRFGIPNNIFSGIAQPFGTLTAAFAVHLFLARNKKAGDERPSLLRVMGSEVYRSSWQQDVQAFFRESEEIPLSYDAPLAVLWDEAARRLAAAARDVRLGFPVPIVLRCCSTGGHGGFRQGFERYPVRALCPDCGGKTYCLASPRELDFVPGGSFFSNSLHALYVPAGLQFQAWTRAGRSAYFHLPFRLADVPPLMEERVPEQAA